MFENILPLGTVVLLKDALKKVMIIGFKQTGERNPNIVHDYVGVIYPIGSLGVNSTLLFDNKDITDVVFKGYANPEWDEMIAALEKEFSEHPKLAEKLKLHSN